VVGQLRDVPPIEYARNGDVHLAYQRFGTGDVDLVGIPPVAQNIEVAWEHPCFRRLFDRLSSFSRYLHFDKRGTGMSDRDAGIPSLDQRVDDLRAILDHAGIERAFLSGISEGGPIALLFAATYPERVRGLVIYGTAPVLASVDASHGDELVEAWLSAWGTDQTLTPLGFAPSLAGDPEYLRWAARYERQSASPGDIRRLHALSMAIDVRAVLPLVRVPTLVLHRRDDPISPLENAVQLAHQIPGATLTVLDGADHAPHAGDVEALVAPIEAFVRGPGTAVATADRVLATVLFTDIVQSTELAADFGDRRWRELLDAHDSVAETLVVAHAGRLVKSTGDGLLAVFDGPARAVRCAHAMRQAVAPLGIQLRAGLHAGEIEQRGTDVAGLAVHLAARVQALAQPGEVLVTRTVRDLVVGSELGFESRGTHALKGMPEPWEVLAAR
jgi:class 3 adenylate cyclase/predicted esterase